MTLVTELAERMGYMCAFFAESTLFTYIKELDEEIKKAASEETGERLREYREDLREITLKMLNLVNKLRLDEHIDPEVSRDLGKATSNIFEGGRT